MCGASAGEGTHSSCGSWFDASKKDFPSVPFSNWDFNDNKCKTDSGEIENYGDAYQVMTRIGRIWGLCGWCWFKYKQHVTNSRSSLLQVRDCRLVSLLDLALEKDYVRGKVIDFLNVLIDMGVAGFRVDACKHMWPGDLAAVYGGLHHLNTKWFSADSRPFIFQEVQVCFICFISRRQRTTKRWRFTGKSRKGCRGKKWMCIQGRDWTNPRQ